MRHKHVISAVFLSLFASAALSADLNQRDTQKCFANATRLSNLTKRDDYRILCMRSNIKKMSIDSCLNFAKGMEYSFNSENMVLMCAQESQSKLTPRSCLKSLQVLQYGESKDSLIWSCIKKSSVKINKSQCLQLAAKMVYFAQQQRAEIFCENEI
jgi:hypothetical protein